MAEVRLSEAHRGQRLSLDVGDTVILTLPENASTGYRWSLGEIDRALLTTEEAGYRATCSGVGSVGDASWVLRACSAGHVRIDLKRWRPWEGERSVVERFHVELDIRARRAGRTD